jgi:hypothetical protein
MTFARTIADTTATRNELRLVVIAQWIAAGLALIRSATTTGRGLVGGAVALWQLAQAVRLAILLARRLKQAQDASNLGASDSGAPSWRAPGPASTPVPAWSLEAAPLDDDALRRAMAELEAVIADALSAAPPRRASLWEPELPARIPARTSHEADGPIRRPHGRPTPPLGLRPLRPPGLDRPYRRRRRTPSALNTAPTPIAPWRSGATRWLRA